jgi:hypothetical protein
MSGIISDQNEGQRCCESRQRIAGHASQPARIPSRPLIDFAFNFQTKPLKWLIKLADCFLLIDTFVELQPLDYGEYASGGERLKETELLTPELVTLEYPF